ncbi:MAG: ornithine carbamoyltransferase, partial [Candidatus Poseidoniaceae archaeon]
VSMGEEGLKDKMNDFDGFQVNMELIENADKNWAFMHCLPAHRGDEVTDEVMDHANSIVFDQAENRMWAQMSLLAYLVDNGAWGAMGEMMGVGF